MNLTLPIPDELANRLGSGDELARRALEAFAAEEFRAGRLSRPELRGLLGFGTQAELDGFLKTRGLFEEHGQGKLVRGALERFEAPARRIRAFRAGKALGGLDPVGLICEGRR